MKTSRVIFFGLLLIFWVDCAISGDDAVRKYLDELGIEKDIKDMDAEERAVVIGRAAERYRLDNEIKKRLEELEINTAKMQLKLSMIVVGGAAGLMTQAKKEKEQAYGNEL